MWTKRLKRFILLTVILFAVICLFSFALAEDKELVYNGGFEELDEYGEPVGWYTDAWVRDEGYTLFSCETDGMAPEGERYAAIRSLDMNDARFVQEIAVEPESLYRVSCLVRGNDIKEGRGANLSVEGLYAFSEGVFDTEGEWVELEWYGETGENQHSVILYVRLGGYSGESVGEAAFDQISMTRVDEIPGDTIAEAWYKMDDGYDGISVLDDGDDETEDANARGLLVSLTLLYVIAFAVILNAVRKRENGIDITIRNQKNHDLALGMILLFAFVFRMILAAINPGYAVDVNCFRSWGNTMRENGPVMFYQSSGFCDYPPAYTWILGLNSLLSNALKNIFGSVSPEVIDRIVFRAIPSLADIAIVIVFRRIATRHGCGAKTTLVMSGLLAFFPAFILNSACWGQMDSVLCLLLLLVAMTAAERKWVYCLPLYILSVLVKPQALMLGPLGLAALIMEWIQHPESRKPLLKGIGFALAVLLVIVVPFTLQQEPRWLIDQYARTLGSYPYATLNTANFPYILGGNWNAADNIASPWMPFGLCLLSAAYGWMLVKRGKNKQDTLLIVEIVLAGAFTLTFLVFGILGTASWSLVGWTAMAFGFAVTVPPMIRSGDPELLPLLGGLLYLLLFVFGIKMHERYLIPAFALMAAAWAVYHDDRILLVLLATGSTLFLNEGIVLDNSVRLGSSMGHLNNDTIAVADLLALINIAASVYGVISFRKIADGESSVTIIKGHTFGKVQEVKGEQRAFTKDRSLHWNRKDSLIVLTISAVFAVVTFLTLGSTKAPQNAWTSSSPDEEIVFDLGSEYENFSMLYFSRVSRNNFSVSVSTDGENWEEDIPAQMNVGECYKWKYVTRSWTDEDGNTTFYGSSAVGDIRKMTARFVRVRSEQIGLVLCEVLFRDAEWKPIATTVVSHTGAVEESPNYSSADALLDEQDTLEGIPDPFGLLENAVAQPGWYNSTYFDEIYHARTAYEHLAGTVPYETTHPPLGKLIISLGILLFGMTPFGWRFGGALAGVMMIPAIYLLAKQLTKKTRYATLAALLMTLDCMHLTQTQIATIDSFPVLFIILSFFFMLRFMQTDMTVASVREMLPSLAFSGLFMGLAIASKWIGIYAGAGLAVLYFIHGIRSMCYEREQSEERNVPRKFVTLCLYCLLFFVAVPLVIYLLSYIPYFAYNRSIHDLGGFIRNVIGAQETMFSYHSTPGLGMDHPFYSPWYEWPLIKKPMYYAMDSYLETEAASCAIFSFGNPAVWYVAIPCVIFGIVCLLKERRYLITGRNEGHVWHLEASDYSPVLIFVTIGFLAQFLPWVLVPRGTYIYHYFASVPFLILFTVVAFEKLHKRHQKVGNLIETILVIAAVLFFIGFFPYASGIVAPKGWLDLMKFFLKVYY